VVAQAVVKVAVQAVKAAVVVKAQAVVARNVIVAMRPAAPAAVAKPIVRAPFTFASSSASDDPHFNMFDGAIHDAMVWGWFTFVKSPVLTIQVYSSYCGYFGGTDDIPRPPTCIKRGVLQVRVPNTNMRLVSTTDGIIKEFGVDASQKVAGRFLHGRYTASAGVINSVGDCHLTPTAPSRRVSRAARAPLPCPAVAPAMARRLGSWAPSRATRPSRVSSVAATAPRPP